MSNLDKLTRDVEQMEAGTEALAGIVLIMWNKLINGRMEPEYAIRVIEAWISTTMQPNRKDNYPPPQYRVNFTNKPV